MTENEVLYGAETATRVSLGYGTVKQAATDTYPGALDFGYDEATKAGAIYREGKLVSSRVLDIVIANAQTIGMKTVTVKYVDEAGDIQSAQFTSVSEELIAQIQASAGQGGPSVTYSAGDYISIDAENKISVDKAGIIAGLAESRELDAYATKAEIADFVDADAVAEAVAGAKNELAGDIADVDARVDALDASVAELDSIYAKVGDIKTYSAGENVAISTDGEISVSTETVVGSVMNELEEEGILNLAAEVTDQGEAIEALKSNYISGAEVEVPEEEGAEFKTVKIAGKKDGDNDAVEFAVPTDAYYQGVDGRLDALEEKSEEVATEVKWQSVDELVAAEEEA